MGNSTGLILPKPILVSLGIDSGSTMELVVEDGRVIATPVRSTSTSRDGWEADAERIGNEEAPEHDDWLSFGNDSESELTW
jgi:antitoxin MazE